MKRRSFLKSLLVVAAAPAVARLPVPDPREAAPERVQLEGWRPDIHMTQEMLDDCVLGDFIWGYTSRQIDRATH